MSPSESRKARIARRTFLRGVGVTMALPWLESLPVWGGAVRTASAAEASTGGGGVAGATPPLPQRLARMFMGKGINGNHWWAKGQGADMKLSKTLEPLEPVKTKINVINGLFNQPAVGKGIHPGQTGNILSGVPLQKGATVKAGVSMDQILAQRVGQDTL